MTRKKSNDRRLEIRLPRELTKQAKRAARRRKRPLSEIIRDFLVSLVSEQGT